MHNIKSGEPNSSTHAPELSIHSQELLALWYERRHQCQWAVGFLVDIKGSSYRKPGAMMLFNDLGQHFGLMSGGCLEGHLAMQANKALQNNTTSLISYDLDMPERDNSSDELTDDQEAEHWSLSIGCGGSVTIWIAPINHENQHLQFEQIYQALKGNQTCQLELQAENARDANAISTQLQTLASSEPAITASAHYEKSHHIFTVNFQPAVRFFICGAGVDAIPLAHMAVQMGWAVDINETRSQYQRGQRFDLAVTRHAKSLSKLQQAEEFKHADCIIIMQHNLELDAAALEAAYESHARYIGVLGPPHRLNNLLDTIGKSQSDFNQRLHGPCGLALGGDNPASVALSIISHCHAVIGKASMKSLPV